MTEEKEEGKIVFLNEKGYGFLNFPSLTKNVFFHAKELKNISFDKLNKDDQVRVDSISETEKGYNAKGVYLII